MKLFLVFFVLLNRFSSSQAKTTLQTACKNLTNGFYYGHSCFVKSATQTTAANIADCDLFLNGHLAFVLTQKTLDRLQSEYGAIWDGNCKYIGLVRINFAVANKGWVWVHSDGRKWEAPGQPGTMLWDNGEGNGGPNQNYGGLFYLASNGLHDITITQAWHAICEYEEPGTRIYRKLADDKKGHNETVISEVNNIDIYKCAKICRDAVVCRSFAYSTSSHHCIIHWTDGKMTNYGPVDAQGYQIWYVDY